MANTPTLATQGPQANNPRRSRSRRGSMNLNFSSISLLPLTPTSAKSHHSNGDYDGGGGNEDGPERNKDWANRQVKLRNGSYIEAASAPTTPGVLSMSPNIPLEYFNVAVPSHAPSVRSGCTTPRRRSRHNSNSSGGKGIIINSNQSALTSSSSTPKPSTCRYTSPSDVPSSNNVNTDTTGGLQPRKSKSTGQLTSLDSLTPYCNSRASTPSSYYSVQTTMSMSSLNRSKSKEREREKEKNSYWMHRTGVLLTSESRESKGQSWLVSRASSTSLIDFNDEPKIELSSRSHNKYYAALSNSDYMPPQSPSAGSRQDEFYDVGSEFDTPIGRRTPRSPRYEAIPSPSPFPCNEEEAMTEYYYETAGEDLYEDGGECEEDDLDRYYSQGRSLFSLGSLIDRVIGWSLFSFEDAEEEAEREREWERKQKEQQEEEYNKRMERERAWQDSRMRRVRATETVQGGEVLNNWGDPAWLFAIAAKVLF